jgi:hypothetical protein
VAAGFDAVVDWVGVGVGVGLDVGFGDLGERVLEGWVGAT